MRVEQEIKQMGQFWLPAKVEDGGAKPDRKFQGELTVSNGGKVILRLVGTTEELGEIFDEDIFPDTPARMVGVLEEGGPVTLERGLQINGSRGSSKLPTATYTFEQALVGIEYYESESPQFSLAYFSVDGLEDWMGVSRHIRSDENELGEVSVNYGKQNDITIELDNGMKLSIRHHVLESWSRQISGSRMNMVCDMELKSDSEMPLGDFTEVMHKLVHFFRYVTGEEVCLKNVSAITKEVESYKPIDIYYTSMPFNPKVPEIWAHNSFCQFHLVEDHLPDIIPKWIAMYDTIGSAVHLFFSVYRYEGIEVEFTEIAKALEVLHSDHPGFSAHEYMDETKFQAMLQKFETACTTTEERQFLKDKSTHWNKVIFTQRMKELVVPLKGIAWNSRQTNSLSGKIVQARDEIAHTGKPQCLGKDYGTELFTLSRKAELILLVNIGKIAGMPTELLNFLMEQFLRRYNALDIAKLTRVVTEVQVNSEGYITHFISPTDALSPRQFNMAAAGIRSGYCEYRIGKKDGPVVELEGHSLTEKSKQALLKLNSKRK